MNRLIFSTLSICQLLNTNVLGKPSEIGKQYAFCGTIKGRSWLNEDVGSEEIPDDVRIVGGVLARPNEVSYLVSIQEEGYSDYYHMCGGSIFSERWIITAAHCFSKSQDNDKYHIIAGEHNLDIPEETEQIIKVKRIIIHPYFDAADNNDIALLELVKPLTYNQHVKPIKIPACNDIPQGSARISGWGHVTSRAVKDNSDVTYADILRLAEVNVYSQSACQQSLGKAMKSVTTTSKKSKGFTLHENSFCAGYLDRSVDSCQGDSGGPLACHDKNGGDTLCGIVSYGFGCGLKGIPGIYTFIPHFHDWIVNVAV